MRSEEEINVILQVACRMLDDPHIMKLLGIDLECIQKQIDLLEWVLGEQKRFAALSDEIKKGGSVRLEK